jgi:hypothetical protein
MVRFALAPCPWVDPPSAITCASPRGTTGGTKVVTLNITLISQRAIYQSADFLLSDGTTGAPLTERGHKSVLVNRLDWSALVCYAGVARAPHVDVARWLGGLVLAIPNDAPFAQLLDSLTTADAWLSSIPLQHRAHTFSVAAFDGDRPSMSLVTNCEHLTGSRATPPAARVYVETIHPTGPKLYAVGVPNPFPRHERRLMERSTRRAPDEVSKMLAAMNRRVSAALSGKYVGASCTVSYLEPTGRGVTVAFGVKAESADFMPPDIAALLRAQGISLKPRVIDGVPQPIQLVQMATNRDGDRMDTLMEIQGLIDDPNDDPDRDPTQWTRLR